MKINYKNNFAKLSIKIPVFNEYFLCGGVKSIQNVILIIQKNPFLVDNKKNDYTQNTIIEI